MHLLAWLELAMLAAGMIYGVGVYLEALYGYYRHGVATNEYDRYWKLPFPEGHDLTIIKRALRWPLRLRTYSVGVKEEFMDQFLLMSGTCGIWVVFGPLGATTLSRIALILTVLIGIYSIWKACYMVMRDRFCTEIGYRRYGYSKPNCSKLKHLGYWAISPALVAKKAFAY